MPSSHLILGRSLLLLPPILPSIRVFSNEWVENEWKETEKFLEMGIPDHLTCVLRNLYAGEEATIRAGYGTMNWFKIEKGVCQGCILLIAFLTSKQSTPYEMPG